MIREFFFGAVLSLQDLIKMVSFTLEKSDDLIENKCLFLFFFLTCSVMLYMFDTVAGASSGQVPSVLNNTGGLLMKNFRFSFY